METLIYKGKIKECFYGNNSAAIFIGESDMPIAEIFFLEIVANNVSVRYWISDKEVTKEGKTECFLKKIYGAIDADYTHQYSEYTGYLWTYEELKIGGHDIMNELMNNIGMYIYMEVDIHD